jgi:AAA family ATP:ADP antiporter
MRLNYSKIEVAAWSAITFFALLASYMAFRPVRDSLILEDFDKLPWIFTGTLVVTVIASPIWSAILARTRPRRAVPVTFHVFAACLIVFAILVGNDIAPLATSRTFYIWSALFNLFVVSVFWSLLADLLGPAVAKQLYGPIAAGGTVGAILGPMLTRLLVDDIGIDGVLLMSAAFLELAVFAAARVRREGEALVRADGPVPADEPTRGNPFRAFEQIARTPYLLAIVGFVLCTAIASTFVYMEQAGIVRASLPNRIDATEFFASIDLWSQILTLGVQTFIAPLLLAYVGPGIMLMFLPLAQAVGITALVTAPALRTLFVVQLVTRTLTHGITRPARELLFTVVTRDEKYRAKNAIDVVGYRTGDFISSWTHQGLKAVGAGSTALVAAMLPLSAIWLGLALFLGLGYRKRAKDLAAAKASE